MAIPKKLTFFTTHYYVYHISCKNKLCWFNTTNKNANLRIQQVLSPLLTLIIFLSLNVRCFVSMPHKQDVSTIYSTTQYVNNVIITSI
jgi:hypothetical protein